MRDIRALNRGGRINQMIIAFQQSIKAGHGDELTAYDLANKIGMRPQSPAFRDHLKAALDKGVLTCREVQTNRRSINGGIRFMFKLSDEQTPKKREVVIKTAGVVVGQMRLF